MKYFELLVDKNDLSKCQIHTSNDETIQLSDEEVLLRIDNFSFTSNNITYAVVGEQMQYWNFFPATDPWGKVPCWGFAEVVESKHTAIEVGERLYGYYPMASHLKVHAGKIDPFGFYDISSHRMPLPIIYNHYVRTSADPFYERKHEGLYSIFRPLFATSFLLDDYLYEEAFKGATSIWCTSASSKTSIAFAFLLKHQRAERNIRYEIIGLTSDSNKAFVESLDIYDKVIAYDAIDEAQQDQPTIVVDFAGNKPLLIQLQEHLGDHLKYFCHIGLSHWEKSSGAGSITVPSEFFFAPTQAEKRTREWGGQGLRSRMAAVFSPFLEFSASWLTWRKEIGSDRLKAVYEQFIAGSVNPREGVVIINEEGVSE